MQSYTSSRRKAPPPDMNPAHWHWHFHESCNICCIEGRLIWVLLQTDWFKCVCSFSEGICPATNGAYHSSMHFLLRFSSPGGGVTGELEFEQETRYDMGWSPLASHSQGCIDRHAFALTVTPQDNLETWTLNLTCMGLDCGTKHEQRKAVARIRTRNHKSW